MRTDLDILSAMAENISPQTKQIVFDSFKTILSTIMNEINVQSRKTMMPFNPPSDSYASREMRGRKIKQTER